MKKVLSELFRFAHSFGAVKGPLLYLKIKTGGWGSLQVPGISYPIRLRKQTSDYDTFYQAIVHRQYKFNYGVDPKIIIDGGANVGLASIAFKNMFPQATIIAVEPDKENFAALQENLRPYKNIHTIEAGLWNKSAFLKISDKYNFGKWGMITEEVLTKEESTISTTTIGDIISNFKIDYVDILKLDIETAEKELFSSDYESWLPRVKVIVIELHDSITPGTAKPFFVAINKTFSQYRFFQLGENTIVINEDLVKRP